MPPAPTSTTTSPPPANPPSGKIDKRKAAREVIDILHEISTLLNTQLDRTQLSLCVSLLENGVNPEALANVIKTLRRENESIRTQAQTQTQTQTQSQPQTQPQYDSSD